ncbi:Sphingomyelin synthase-related 1 [Diplonema papillatum]|nr:Sphingomyelin synthase-related 1 [Diplonema papillatum]
MKVADATRRESVLATEDLPMKAVATWSSLDVSDWLRESGLGEYVTKFSEQRIDGSVLLAMAESDLRQPPLAIPRVGDIKRISHAIAALRGIKTREQTTYDRRMQVQRLFMGMLYCAVSIAATSFSLVTAHERVPNTDAYPPLPDLFLNNVPRVPWAFAASEVAVFLLGVVLALILVMHKSRLVIATRFLAITGTVFLLRCFTMLMTSLSVPGEHLDCPPLVFSGVEQKLERMLTIMSGLGTTVLGVTTCGDYMFSGHCSGLTIIACFVCEYTPESWTSFHRTVWATALSGIVCVLAGHEHYSIDCFIAFYISSRVFAYYHTLALQMPVMTERQASKVNLWFPLVAYFEHFTSADDNRNTYEHPLAMLQPPDSKLMHD